MTKNLTQVEQNLSSAFKSNSALGKATTRVARVLPKSPRKKLTVIHRLFKSYVSLSALPSALGSWKKASHTSTFTKEIVTKVVNFYNQDDVSRQAPGRKDVVIIRKDGKKMKLQARHLISSIKETHAMFCEKNGKLLGKSQFAELRPQEVLLCSKLPHNVCLCKHHENYFLAINSLHKFIPDVFPAYSSGFPNSLICEEPTKSCWLSDCAHCKDTIVHTMDAFFDEIPENVSWSVWKNNESGKLCKIKEEGCKEDLKNHIINLTGPFMEHCYTKREQAKAYQQQRETAMNFDSDPHALLIQVDFSENYTCIAQDEIQSFHWKQNQVSLLTCAMWHNGNLNTLVLASDNLNHSKETVVAYMDVILDQIPEYVQDISVWSDGPSSQFKNRYIVAALPVLEKKHKKNISWNYFATSHGKGPVDGIGGAVKRQV